MMETPESIWLTRANAKAGSAKLLRALLKMSGAPRAVGKYRFYTCEVRARNYSQMAKLQKIVAEHFGVPAETMRQRRGLRSVAQARQVAMYLSREVIKASYPDIGRCFGGKDHTTVMHARNVTANRIDLCEDIVEITAKLATLPSDLG